MAQDFALSLRTAVGRGDARVLVEARDGSVRIKARHGADVFVPWDAVGPLADVLASLARDRGTRASRK